MKTRAVSLYTLSRTKVCVDLRPIYVQNDIIIGFTQKPIPPWVGAMSTGDGLGHCFITNLVLFPAVKEF